MRLIGLVVLALVVLPAPLAAEAQQAVGLPRVGYLGPASASSDALLREAFRQGLRERGWIEGQNVVIESRWAEGRLDRLPDLAAELVRLKVDVLVTAGTPGALAAKQATTTIPIVMVGIGDAVATASSPASRGRAGTSPDQPILSRNSWRNCSSCSRRSCRAPGASPSS